MLWVASAAALLLSFAADFYGLTGYVIILRVFAAIPVVAILMLLITAILRTKGVATDLPMTKIALRGPHGDVETLWAEVFGGGHYCLANTPWYAYRISWRDVVEASSDADG